MGRKTVRPAEKGATTFIIVFLVIALAFLIVNGFGSVVKEEDIYGTPTPEPNTISGSCCDTGNGAACTLKDPTITYKGKEYKLIKSGISLSEGSGHLEEAGTVDGKKVILNTTGDGSDVNGPDTAPVHPNCGPQGDDLFFAGGYGCSSLPNDTIIYLCQKGCDGVGTGEKILDAYFLKDKEIPDFIKNCHPETYADAPSNDTPGGDQLVFPSPEPSADQALQLRHFDIVKRPAGPTPWLSPYCKPAIYLYPKEKTDVSVKVAPVGEMSLTIPTYPAGGWKVTAYPNGNIQAGADSFDYLYYEARIPDEKIEKPQQGFVRKPEEVEGLLKEILPKLGLNDKEGSEFISYWSSVLPKQPAYYFVGVVSTDNLDQISPLNITPRPDKTIRVTIYFQALDGPINVEAPVLEAPSRDGFTVVEWGGIFKKDPKYPFSCFM